MELEIKAKFAQNLFVQLLKDSGYEVIQIDYGKKLQEMAGSQKIREYSQYIKDIKNHNDVFLVLGKSPLSLRIRLVAKINKDVLIPYAKGNSAIVFITPAKPFFSIAWSNEFSETGETQLLEDNSVLKIKKSLIRKYAKKLESLLK